MSIGFSDAKLSPIGRGTLGRQLVIQVAVIVTVIALLVSMVSFFSVQAIVVNRTDAQLQDLLGRQGSAPRDRDDKPRGSGGLPGMPVGGIVVESGPNGISGSRLTTSGWVALDPTTIARIVDQASSRRQTVSVTGLGSYRFQSDVSQAVTRSVGLPLGEAERTINTMLWIELLLAALAVGVALIVTRAVVARNLRPLHEVAQVAAEVSQRELDRGEVDLSVRVPAQDTDPSSEVGRVGLALNTMLNNVESALEARQASETKVRQFVADASHELRNPLAAIRGYSELTRRSREELPEDARFAMSRIESESERMSRLVDDMLLLARIDSGPALTLQRVDGRELVLNAVADAQVAGPDHEWDVSVPDESVTMTADPYRLQQVVANLLANARTHTPAGTEVSTALAIDGADAVITVSDNGPGVPAELQPRVFERFVRADAARARTSGQSTGLGLAIVAAVVQAHGGQVSVDSVPGHTSFVLRIPLAGPPSS